MENNKTSISVRVDAGIIGHNNREFFASNVDPDRVKDNIIYKQEDLKQAYETLFSNALKIYNEKQNRADRKINDYLEHILNSKQEKPFYETIIQFGDMKDTAVGSERGEIAKKMLDEYMRGFEKRNPNLYVFNSVMHLDEATPHLHIDFIPLAKNQKRGLPTRVSLKKALEQQGVMPKNKKETERQQWALIEKSIMRSISQKYGLSVIDKGIHRKHLNPIAYKIYANSTEFNKYKAGLQNIPLAEIDRIVSLNTVLKKNLEAVSLKINAKREDFIFGDEQKLNYIAEQLLKENVNISIESQSIRAPSWAAKRIEELKQEYRPKPVTWREQTKLDIDRLIYGVENINELWEALRKIGYDVKIGKYISIKPKNAERSLRTKSLGAEYSEEMLIQRIKANRNYEKICDELIKSSLGMEREFHITVKNVVILIYNQKKSPQKVNKDKPYTIKNDKHINELVNCISFIKTNAITSGVVLQSRLETSEEKINETERKIKELQDMQVAIKDLREKAKLYFNSLSLGKQSTMQETKIAVAKKTLEAYGIKNQRDLLAVDETFIQNESELKTLTETVSSERGKISELAKLSEVHEQIRCGGYINYLIKVEKERITNEISPKAKRTALI